MYKKVIFFSIDRLGDYLIRSNVIKQISDKYDYSEIVCSEKNYRLVSYQNFFSKVVLFNNRFKFVNKLKFIFLYTLKKFDSCIVFDGKNISILLIFLIRSKFKFVFLYEKKGLINFYTRKIMIYAFKIFNIKYKYLYSRKLIEEKNFEKYPQKYKILNKYFHNNSDDTYYFDNTNINQYSHLHEKYILIHLDEKFIDIKHINSQFEASIIELQKKTGKLVFLTSFKNNFEYYRNLNFEKINLDYLNKIDYLFPDIVIIEDLPLADFQNLIKNSYINISCHAGFLVHTSLAFKKKTIDIINESEEIWLDTWVQKSDNYKIVFKSIINKTIEIKKVLELVNNEIH